MQANQWAIKANVAIKSNNTAAPYSEYLSIFRATRTNRRRRAVFNKPIRVVVWKNTLLFQDSLKVAYSRLDLKIFAKNYDRIS